MIELDDSKELSYLILRRGNLQERLKHIESILDLYEQLHITETKFGESFLLRMPGIEKSTVEDFLAGDWCRRIEDYKVTYNELYVVERRICELKKH